MYVNYEYYVDQYGGRIPEEEFPSVERKAEAYIRKLTYIRGNIFEIEDVAVKDAVCAVAEVYHSCEKKNETGTVKSENNDGYSVSYAVEQLEGQTVEELIRKKAYEAVFTYLLPTGWLSRKVRCCHADQCNDYNI
jgi:hypothetical protein